MFFSFESGGELFAQLKKSVNFSESTSKLCAAEILLALEFLHKNNIIYRDLKPENIILDSEGHVKLADFGLAKELAKNCKGTTNSFCGTPEYMAPEVILNTQYDKSVDIWELGIFIYEMLAGKVPWESPNRMKLYNKILNEPLDLSHNNLSHHAKDLLSKMLEKNTKNRLKDPKDIKNHPFFSDLDFDKVYKKMYKTSFILDSVIFIIINRVICMLH